MATADQFYADPSALELGLSRFVTFDARQQKLARAVGLKVIEPS